MPTLEFKGKPFVYSHHLSVPFRELVVDPKKSLPAKGQKASLDDNLIIHGDNLDALKALLPRYAGKVDVIYIDPPYNTGDEGWAYNDNVNSILMKQWLHKVVDRDDLERHEKWCCMMWPRLQLLKELLSARGLIFISIDENELSNLLLICDETFGRENRVETIIWKKSYGGGAKEKHFVTTHEYVVCYSNDKNSIGYLDRPISDEKITRYYVHKDEHFEERGPYANTLTAERVRRVIKGIPTATEKDLKVGLGGSFTYCDLGQPLDLERFFDGKGAPTYEQVARYVVYTATGHSVTDVPKEPRKDWFVVEAGGYRIYLIYKPDLAFMRGNDAALALPLAKEIVKGAKGKPTLVYAAAKFMSQTELTKGGITFCQLPYSVHRVLGEAPDAS